MSQFDWPITKKLETMEAAQNRRFYGMRECLTLWPTYIGEKGRTLGKKYGISKVLLGTPLGNTMGTQGTYQEPLGNMMRT